MQDGVVLNIPSSPVAEKQVKPHHTSAGEVTRLHEQLQDETATGQ